MEAEKVAGLIKGVAVARPLSQLDKDAKNKTTTFTAPACQVMLAGGGILERNKMSDYPKPKEFVWLGPVACIDRIRKDATLKEIANAFWVFGIRFNGFTVEQIKPCPFLREAWQRKTENERLSK